MSSASFSSPSYIYIYIYIFNFFKGEMGPEFSLKMVVKSLTSQQIVRIHQLFRQAKFDDPSGDVSCFWSSHSLLLFY